MHTLAHDRATELPPIHRRPGVCVPADVTELTVEGRDLTRRFGGGGPTIRRGPR